MSVVIHEVSHGFMAERFGDKTARMAGRLTLNPLKHLDLFGSVLVPIFLYFSAGFAFGWAKPVPYNPNNLTDRKRGTIAVAAAGILANIFVALIFGIFIRIAMQNGIRADALFVPILIVQINLALAIFNLVPIPPLDGSKILPLILPRRYAFNIERFGFMGIFIVFIFVYLFAPIISKIAAWIFLNLAGSHVFITTFKNAFILLSLYYYKN